MSTPVKVVGLFEAAELFGMSRTNFNLHRNRWGGEGQCPAPSVNLKCGPVWVGPDVTKLEKWSAAYAKQRAADAKAAQDRKDAKAKRYAPGVEAAAAAKKVPVAKKAPAKKVAAKKAAPKKGGLLAKSAA